MLRVLTTSAEYREALAAIGSVERLDELVDVHTEARQHTRYDIAIHFGKLHIPLDWHDFAPPYLIPPLGFTRKELLALIFLKLKNYEKAYAILPQDATLRLHIRLFEHLHVGKTIAERLFSLQDADALHNRAIVLHYGNVAPPADMQTVMRHYKRALEASTSCERAAYTAKSYTELLLDTGRYAEAQRILSRYAVEGLSAEAQNAMRMLWAALLTHRLKPPYAPAELSRIDNLYSESMAFYESRDLPVNRGMAAMQASDVALLGKRYTKAHTLIGQAVRMFKAEGVEALLAEAFEKQGLILFTWSKDGAPHYFNSAIHAYRSALKIVKRDADPSRYAALQHHLALAYAEIAMRQQEQPLWAAFSASAFKEALTYYTRHRDPHRYAAVAQNYAVALMNFPPATLHDNLKKAHDLLEEALAIRDCGTFAFERAIVLNNLLELYWMRYREKRILATKYRKKMIDMANEIIALSTDERLTEKAKEHLEQLAKHI